MSELFDQVRKKLIQEDHPELMAKKGRPKNKSTYDWDAILEEYVVGYVIVDPETGSKQHIYPTLNQLSEKYGCSLAYMQQKSSKEGWSVRRQAFQAKLREKASTQKFHSYISQSASTDARTLLAIDKMYALIEAYFEQYEGLEIGRDGNFHIAGYTSDDDEDRGLPIKVNDLKGLIDVLDKAQALVRRTVGEPLNTPMTDPSLFNPMADTGATGSKENGANVESLINKRGNYKKTEAQLRKEIEELQKELED